jgi:hypothetical protein
MLMAQRAMQTKKRITGVLLLLVVLGMLATIGVITWSLLRPTFLTQQHGAEMRNAVQRYLLLLNSVEGQSDPAVISDYATGEYLEYLMRVRCIDCPSVQVADRIEVVDLRVLDYSPGATRVWVRVEYGWSTVSPQTREPVGECHAQAFSAQYIFQRDDGNWKVIDGEEVDPNRVDDSSQLRAKYCK